jgi:hypothetical protein
MKQFVLFTGLLGSDQLLPIDGRFGRERAIQEANNHASNLLRLHNKIGKAKLCRGTIKNHRVLCEWDPE